MKNKKSIQLAGENLFKIILFGVLVLFLANLNAIVDAVLHPEIPYFDEEHLIVGGVVGFVTAVIFILLGIYMYRLESALKRIRDLESIVPVCSSCKSIRYSKLDDPNVQESWTKFESFFKEITRKELTHGMCPECIQKLYSEYTADAESR